MNKKKIVSIIAIMMLCFTLFTGCNFIDTVTTKITELFNKGDDTQNVDTNVNIEVVSTKDVYFSHTDVWKNVVIKIKEGETVVKECPINDQSITVSGLDFSTPGEKKVTITYGDKSIEYVFEVEEIKIKYAVSKSGSAVGGYIEGDLTQYAMFNSEYNEVVAIANEGYEFLRWNDGNTNPSRRDVASTEKTIYAQFVASKMSYSFYDQEGAIIDGYSGTLNYNSKIPTNKIPDMPEIEGKEFVGWVIKGTQSLFDINSIVSDSIMLQAKYADKKVSVSYYDYNGNMLKKDAIAYGGSYDINKYIAPTIPGSIFKGWAPKESYGNIDYNNLTRDIELIALYEKVSLNIKFYADDLLVSSSTCLYNGKANAYNYIKDGYRMYGWAVSPTSDVAFDFNTAITTDMVFYAILKKIPTDVYTITVKNEVNDSVEILYRDKNDLIGELPTIAVIEGKEIIGYVYQNDGSKVNPNDIVLGNITILAKYSDLYVTVSFNTQQTNNKIDSIDIVYGTFLNSVPTANSNILGYDFVGWYYDENCTERYNNTDILKANTELFAKWKIKTFIISFTNANGVVSNLAETNNQIEVVYGSSFTVKVYIENGYKVESLKENSTEQWSAYKKNEVDAYCRELKNITTNYNIVVKSSSLTYSIDYNNTGSKTKANGSISYVFCDKIVDNNSINKKVSVNYNANLTFKVTPVAGYMIDSVKYDGKDVVYDNLTGEFTIKNIVKQSELVVEYTQIKYYVSWTVENYSDPTYTAGITINGVKSSDYLGAEVEYNDKIFLEIDNRKRMSKFNVYIINDDNSETLVFYNESLTKQTYYDAAGREISNPDGRDSYVCNITGHLNIVIRFL